MHAWFRFYNSAPDNPKLGVLSDAHFRHWIYLLCIASKNSGVIPNDLAKLAHTLRRPIGKVADILQVLLSARLIEACEGGYTPHDWATYQYKSDVSTERVKRFRSVSRNTERNVSETSPDNRLQNTDSEERNTSLRSVQRKGTRWPLDQSVSEDWKHLAGMKRAEHGLAQVNLDLVAETFVNYWIGKAGQNGTKVDWQKTWINWALKAENPRNGNGKASPHANFAAGAYLAATRDRSGTQ